MTEKPVERVTADSPRTTAPELHPWLLRAIMVGVIVIAAVIVMTILRFSVGGDADPSVDPLPPREEILNDPAR